MTLRDLTEILLISFFGLLGAYDLFLIYWLGRPEASISVVIHEACLSHPILAFLLGMLAGHIMFPIWSLGKG